MRYRGRARLSLVLTLSALLVSALLAGTARGEPMSPLGAPPKMLAASYARVAAEQAVLSVAAQTMAEVEALERVGASALLAAQSRVQLVQRALQNPAALSTRGSSPMLLVDAPREQPGQVRVPILMYHHIADAPPDADPVRRDLSVGPLAFAQQMDYLVQNGYHTISLSDLADRLLNGSSLPTRTVILTFDDGYDDNYSQALAVLRHRGLTGTLFIITDAVGSPGYVTWQQVAELSRSGMSIEAHGRTHADLAVSSAESITWQVTGSRTIIEEKIGRPVRFFCYPSGRYTAQTIAILRAQGYTGAVSTAYGATHTASALFDLARVRVRGSDSLAQFVAKLNTAP